MSVVDADTVLQIVTSFYLDSRDFNGIPALTLVQKTGAAWEHLSSVLGLLIEEDKVGVLYGDTDMNPHIIRMGFPPKDEQVAKLATAESFHTCIYPRPEHLEVAVDRSQYADRPYALSLALGQPQLAYRSFDLSVLEVYRNDPRYLYQNDDVSGHISVRDEYFESHHMAERDQILLESFGFSYDEDLNRAVAVFLCYLADLEPEHQQIWKARELEGDYTLHPDYFRSSILSEWGERVPILSALVEELYVINQMAAAMGRAPLFRKDFGRYGERKPKALSFLVRPTLQEFNSFMLLLDKILSDNINRDFFQEEVPYEQEIEGKDGRTQIRRKGTLQILNDWVRRHYRLADWAPWDEAMKALRDVRNLRQKPAHALEEDIFDQRYFREQRDLVIRAYTAVRTLRLLFANHPKVKTASVEISEWLREGQIWTY